MTLKQRVGSFVLRNLPCSRRSFDILRFEFRILRQRFYNTVLPWRVLKIQRLRSLRDVSLNVGSGGSGLLGWINLDVTTRYPGTYCSHDLRRPLPFADGAVCRIFAEHVIEHMDKRSDVPAIYAEFHRVLKPGGVVRIVVPDARRFMEAYFAKQPDQWKQLGFDELPGDMDTPMDLVNHVFHQGGEHCFGWDAETMGCALKKAGFPNATQQVFGQSFDSELAIDQPHHRPYSLYIEAVK